MANRDSMVVEKLAWHLCPDAPLEEMIKVLMAGKEKYGAWNWISPPYFSKHHIFDSLRRHQAAILKGETHDPESGFLHSAHLLCNAMFACYYDLHSLWSKSGEDEPVHPQPAESRVTAEQEFVDATESVAGGSADEFKALRDSIVKRFEERIRKPVNRHSDEILLSETEYKVVDE